MSDVIQSSTASCYSRYTGPLSAKVPFPRGRDWPVSRDHATRVRPRSRWWRWLCWTVNCVVALERSKSSGPSRFATPRQVTTSLLDENLAVFEPGDAARVRVKTAPGVLGAREVSFLESLGRPVLLDFNCSAGADEDVLEQLASIPRGVEVAAVEQPFAPGNVVDHARLAEQTEVPISLDEGVRNLRDLDQIVRYRAATLVCVKPARVGGYANARTMIERAKELGLRPYVGGFFESELARSVNRTLARHTTGEPSDIGVVATANAGRKATFRPIPRALVSSRPSDCWTGACG